MMDGEKITVRQWGNRAKKILRRVMRKSGIKNGKEERVRQTLKGGIGI